MSNKLTQIDKLEKKLRTRTFLGQELDHKDLLFREVFINSFLGDSVQRGQKKIPVPNSWNIKLVHNINSLNYKLSNTSGYLDSPDIIKDLFIIRSIRAKDSDSKYSWICDKVTEEFKGLVFDNKSSDKSLVLWKSSKYTFTLDISKRTVTLVQKSKNSSTLEFVKLFTIRELDIYPSLRGTINSLSK